MMKTKDLHSTQIQVLNEINDKLGKILALLQQQIEQQPATKKAVSSKQTEKRG